MKEKLAIISVFLAVFVFDINSAAAQFTIKLPDINVKMPDKEQTKKNGNSDTTRTSDKQSDSGNTGGKNIYSFTRATSTPVFLKHSVYIQAIGHNEYWKMKGQRNYSSWVPTIRFHHFWNGDKKMNYTVEYFNPDGSAWYSEKLEQSSRATAEQTIDFQSPSPWAGILDTKSTAATGMFSFTITNDDTKEVLYNGKFKVEKFSTANGGPDKNKFQFYVDHDWLMPFGRIGFHHSNIEIGGVPLEVSVWMKGDVSASELEGRVFYNGQQITSTKDGGGASDYDERMTDMAPAFAPLNRWKRWQFQWDKFRYHNNGGFNPDSYPNSHYADKNPGEYTVEIYRNGTQVRELSFTVGADGKYAVPAYTDQIFMPFHRVLVPVKVIGTEEKWNADSWKTDSFYGNPLSGFTGK